LGGQTPLKVGKHSVDGGYVNVIRKTGHWHVMKRKTKQRRPVEVVKLPLSEVAPKYFYPIATRLMKQQWAQIFVDDFAYRVKRLSEK
jgi:hypothetical protein